MGKLWDIVQAHMDAQPYGVSQRQIAKRLGMSPTALGNWRDIKSMPDAGNLHALADLTGTPYLRVLDAALEDAGYHSRTPDGNAAATSHAEGSSAHFTSAVDDGAVPPPGTLAETATPSPRSERG